ncbi:MAG TPA: hypothetical protein VGO07_01405 [Candidatus Saccharimonadales bacterium]|jgi:hypothetical protein|nr:hypothetical protein [Candidatus Saccharimonadales bacterium]
MNELAPLGEFEQQSAIGVAERFRQMASELRTDLGRAAAAGLLIAGGALTAFTAEEAVDFTPAYATDAPEALIGMPFAGKWAYNANVNPPYTDVNSSHPSVHEAYGFNWATDLYAAQDTDIKVYGSSAQGPVTFKRSATTDTCSQYGANIAGQGVTFDVLINNTKIGEVKYDHIDPENVGDNPIASGTKIGEVTSEALQSTCFQVRHTHVQFKNTVSNYSCYADHGNPGVSLSANDHLGVLGSPNTNAKEACATIPDTTPTAPPPPPPPPLNPFVIRQGNTLNAKANLTDTWTTLINTASDVQASEQRIAIRDTAGNIEAKDGLYGTWLTESGPADQYAITPNALVIRQGGTILAKAALGDGWTTVALSGAVDMQVARNRIVWKDSGGTLWARDGVTGTSVAETTGVSEYDVSSTVLLVRQGNTLSGKASLTDTWVTLRTDATDVRVSANRIAVMDTAGNLDAKDGLFGSWYTETPGVGQYAITPNLLIVRQGSNLIGKVGLADTWTGLGGGAVDLQAAGNRIAVINTDGNLVIKDGLYGTWVTETSAPNQVALASVE